MPSSPAPGPAPGPVVTVYGRMPVLEVVSDDRRTVDRVAVATNAHGPAVDRILAEARRRGIRTERRSADDITRISRNGRHDQGVVAVVAAPRIETLEEWLARPIGGGPSSAVVLDGVTNPANVGLVVRTVTAAGVDAVVLPRAGCPDIGPVVIKASAGVAFDAPIVRAATAPAAIEGLGAAGFRVYGLAGDAHRTLFDPAGFARRSAFVLGNETTGVSPEAAALVHEWVSIPLAGDVDSLNVAVAAGVVCFEILRRRLVG